MFCFFRSRRNLLLNVIRDHLSAVWQHHRDILKPVQVQGQEDSSENSYEPESKKPRISSPGEDQPSKELNNNSQEIVATEYIDSLFLDIACRIREESQQHQQLQRVDNLRQRVQIPIYSD